MDAMATICLIESPPFEVNFELFNDTKKGREDSLIQRVWRAVFTPLEWIGFIFTAVAQAAYVTIRYSWISFKHNVLGYYGSLADFHPPQNFYLVVFKVVFWVLKLFWCFVTTAYRLFIEKMGPHSNEFLRIYAGEEIDLSHLRTSEKAIDVSGVSSEITVDDLMTLFEEINFKDQNGPGYMASSSCKEGEKIYTVEELRSSLTKFITNVKGRVPFIGTPPFHDIPRLMAFYQQIEDAVRFSIYTVNQRLAEFKQSNGTEPTGYSELQMRQYKDILEDRSRLAIDMAIAGQHCGARYMGDSITSYYSFKGETTGGATLQESIVEFLASKRSEIARLQALQHMGSDTHAFSNYMATLGKPLGLPGVSNVVEHLSVSFNSDKFLRLFFQEYTVNCIIETTRAEIKKSQQLRTQITDWISDQVGEWMRETQEDTGH